MVHVFLASAVLFLVAVHCASAFVTNPMRLQHSARSSTVGLFAAAPKMNAEQLKERKTRDDLYLKRNGMLAFREMQRKRAKAEGSEMPPQPPNPFAKFMSSLGPKQ
jgi:hypothetical protein